jgi:hypothetical protein
MARLETSFALQRWSRREVSFAITEKDLASHPASGALWANTLTGCASPLRSPMLALEEVFQIRF